MHYLACYRLFILFNLILFIRGFNTFIPTDAQTDIQGRFEQTFTHVFITYTPIGLHTNTYSHIVWVQTYISLSYIYTT